jgi:hypothetical protein
MRRSIGGNSTTRGASALTLTVRAECRLPVRGGAIRLMVVNARGAIRLMVAGARGAIS